MHIEAKDINDYPWYLRLLFNKQKKKFGFVLLPGLFWGRFPFLYILFLLFWKYLDRDRKNSNLLPGLRSLVQVRVAQLNSCQFCIDYNSLLLAERANSTDKVFNIDKWKKSDLFDYNEKIVLEFVEIVSDKNVNVPEDLMKKLKDLFSEDEIVELTALISFQNMSAKFNASLDIPSQGLCKSK